MKKHITKIVILVFIIFSNQLFAQKLSNVELASKIDTVHVLPLVGGIWNTVNRQAVINSESSFIYSESLKKILPQNSKYVFTYNYTDSLFHNNYQGYSDTLMSYILKLTNSQFVFVSIGKKVESWLDTLDGRYFAIVMYNGYQQSNYRGNVAASIAIAMASVILTGGMYVVVPTTPSPFISTEILIIDKYTKKFVLYNSKKTNGSPIDEHTIASNWFKLIHK